MNIYIILYLFFFFKQKTAYERRISDWSSDVCSSDLPEARLNAQIVSGARSRDQAALVFNLAWKMSQLSPELTKLIRVIPSGKRLIGLPMNVEYKALAAEGKTAHGLSP